MSAPPDRTTRTDRTSVRRDKKCYQMSQIWHTICHMTTKCRKYGTQSACRSQTKSVLGNLGSLGSWTLGSTNVEGGLHSPFPVQTKLDKVTENHQLLCTSSQEPIPVRGITSAYGQRCSRASSNQRSLGFFNRLFLVSKPSNHCKPILDLSKLNLSETIRIFLQQGEWVTSIVFKDAYFHIPIQEQSRKYLRFHIQGRTYQFKALPFGLSTALMQFTVIAKEVKLMAIHKGIRIHQYLDDWLVRARSHQTCLQHTQDLVKMCHQLGWLVNLEKLELEAKQVFDFVGHQFGLKSGRVRPTPDFWQNIQEKILKLLSLPACPVRQFMSLIGLLTATEKQVHLDRLHMRPIQWHHKNNWRVPESLERVIPIPRSLHPHLQWWLEEDNVLHGQPLHPFKHALQICTDALKEGWEAHSNEHTARET